MKKMYLPLIVASVFVFVSVTAQSQDSVRIAFTGMNPHIGQHLYFRVVDKSNNAEVGRTSVLITVPDFTLGIGGIQPGSSYNLDFYADLTQNGRYDFPGDHAWRIVLDTVKGDTTVHFAHNVNFTDISWPYKLTVDFVHMNPHLNQLFKLYLRNNVTGAFIDSSSLDPITAPDFSINLFTIMPDSSYNVDFWADLSGNRQYDAPPTDHAWRIELMDVRGDTVLNFTHNTNFTDIGLTVITGIVDIGRSGFSTYPNPASDELIIKSQQNDRSITGIKIFNSTGRLVIDQSKLSAGSEVRVNVSDLKPGLYILSVSDGVNIKRVKFVKQ